VFIVIGKVMFSIIASVVVAAAVAGVSAVVVVAGVSVVAVAAVADAGWPNFNVSRELFTRTLVWTG
jgi:hypothetical protein